MARLKGKTPLGSRRAGMKSDINMAWEHGGPDFQSRFDKSTAKAQEIKEGVLRVL